MIISPRAAGDGKAVIVLGMHRSGTSVVSQALSICGCAQPRDLVEPLPDNNQKVSQQHEVVRFNETILSALGTSWRQVRPFLLPELGLSASRSRVFSIVVDRWMEEAVDLLCRCYDSASPIVIEDPRIALLLPFWAAAIAKAGYEPCYVLVYRNPLEVAASLAIGNEVTLRDALQLWTIYNLAALEGCPELTGVVSYRNLVDHPVATLAPIVKRIGSGIALLDDAAAELRRYVLATEPDREIPEEALMRSPQIAAIIKDLWLLLSGWDDFDPRRRHLRIAAISAIFEQMTLFSGAVTNVPAAAPPLDAGAPAEKAAALPRDHGPGRREAMRAAHTLILHYHLFKNAGTSVDAMLKHNFGDRWATQEFRGGNRSNSADVAAFLRQHPDICVLSSHTALLPLPDLEGVHIFPIIFLRHPIDRLKSAYLFERKQDSDNWAPQIAKRNDFAGYVREHLANNSRSASNFQTLRLALNEKPEAGSELDRALRTLAALPFVGLVEAYNASIERLQSALSVYFPHFEKMITRRNITRPVIDPLDVRLAEIEEELGHDLYEGLRQANADDIYLFEKMRAQYAIDQAA